MNAPAIRGERQSSVSDHPPLSLMTDSGSLIRNETCLRTSEHSKFIRNVNSMVSQ